MSTIENLFNIQKLQIIEIDCEALSKAMGQGALLIDCREDGEYADGHIPNATHIPRGRLDLSVEDLVPDKTREIVIYCASGYRSTFATYALVQLGYTQVSALGGGIKAWKDQGRSIVQENSTHLKNPNHRYRTQINLKEIGPLGQKKISEARVLIIGAGGLGSPVALYLAGAGVGTIGIVDDDIVDVTNLHRQILHSQERVGIPKVHSAAMTMKALNPDIQINTYYCRLTAENVDSIFSKYDIVIDGCDNFETRYLVNDACVKNGKINVHGSVYQFSGQVGVYCLKDGPCYRCVFESPPEGDLAQSCAEGGVIGALPGVTGSIAALEVIKIILNIGTILGGRLLRYDALATEFEELYIKRKNECLCCSKPTETIIYEGPRKSCRSPHG